MKKRAFRNRNVTVNSNTQVREFSNNLDSLVTVISYLYPLSILPQIYEIWVNKNTAGVSLVTWGMFLVITIILIMYTIKNNDRKLTIMYTLFLLTYVAVVLGLFLV